MWKIILPPTESGVTEGESRGSAEESGGADRTAEAGERKSSSTGGSTHHLHTVPPNSGQGLHLCQPFSTETMIEALYLSCFFFLSVTGENYRPGRRERLNKGQL